MSNHHKKTNRKEQKFADMMEKTDTSASFNLFNGQELSPILEALLSAYRSRIYTVSLALSMFLYQVFTSGSSCQKVVDDLVIKRTALDLPLISSQTGAYCKARKNLSLDLISCLTRSIEGLETGAPLSAPVKVSRPVKRLYFVTREFIE